MGGTAHHWGHPRYHTMMGPRRAYIWLLVIALAGCGTQSGDTLVDPGLQIDESENILVVGDWGSGTTDQEEVAAAMRDYAETNEVGAIVTTGDNFYSSNVEALMEPFDWATENDIPFVISWGNHDVESRRRVTAINETLDDPPRWWSHEWGPIDLLILDSTEIDLTGQTDFLVSELGASDEPTIVVFHHAPYSCGFHGDSRQVLAEWVPLFDNDVFLVLSGHEHNYQRFQSDGVTYVVSGGGGQSLTKLEDCRDDHPRRLAGEAVHHFVALELSAELTVTAIDGIGNIIDEVALALP